MISAREYQLDYFCDIIEQSSSEFFKSTRMSVISKHWFKFN